MPELSPAIMLTAWASNNAADATPLALVKLNRLDYSDRSVTRCGNTDKP
jgi:hypothetical protein